MSARTPEFVCAECGAPYEAGHICPGPPSREPQGLIDREIVDYARLRVRLRRADQQKLDRLVDSLLARIAVENSQERPEDTE